VKQELAFDRPYRPAPSALAFAIVPPSALIAICCDGGYSKSVRTAAPSLSFKSLLAEIIGAAAMARQPSRIKTQRFDSADVQGPWKKNVPGLGLGRDRVWTPMMWSGELHGGPPESQGFRSKRRERQMSAANALTGPPCFPFIAHFRNYAEAGRDSRTGTLIAKEH
jgi:hypothetical protein